MASFQSVREIFELSVANSKGFTWFHKTAHLHVLGFMDVILRSCSSLISPWTWSILQWLGHFDAHSLEDEVCKEIPSRELTSPVFKGIVEVDFPFPKMGYTGSLEGRSQGLNQNDFLLSGVETARIQIEHAKYWSCQFNLRVASFGVIQPRISFNSLRPTCYTKSTAEQKLLGPAQC